MSWETRVEKNLVWLGTGVWVEVGFNSGNFVHRQNHWGLILGVVQ